MYTLGINAAFHDCSAALVKNGEVVAAAEEERFTHVKHGKRPVPFTTWQLPYHAIDYCLSHENITLSDVDRIAYAFDPYALLKKDVASDVSIPLPLQPSDPPAKIAGASPWERLFISYIVNAPRQLVDGVPHHLQARFKGASLKNIQEKWSFIEHHAAHEASAYLAAPFEDTAVLTLDGRGESVSTSYGHFTGGALHRIKQIELPHSLGLLYEEVTDYLGFLRSSDEYKVMALASFGKPVYVDQFREIVQSDGQGGYSVLAPHLARRFGPPRDKDAPVEQRHYDIAHALQVILEETVEAMVRWLKGATGAVHLCMAGGVALNCVMNARIEALGLFESVWVQPAAGDAGTALGAALYDDFVRRGDGIRRWHMSHAFLGPSFDDDEIEAFLIRSKLRYRKLDSIVEDAARLLARDKIIGWFQGRMEFGPRALGSRSILASPISPTMQDRLNDLKDREDFRPVAPVVMEECAADWFDARGRTSICAPFMLFVYDVLPDQATRIPAVRHVDGTARVQTIRRDQHPLYYDLIAAFERKTGVPVLVNTSFNTRGEPVVCTPRDAIECFWTSPLDALFIGSFVLEKEGA